jgi:hypothetical protein
MLIFVLCIVKIYGLFIIIQESKGWEGTKRGEERE